MLNNILLPVFALVGMAAAQSATSSSPCTAPTASIKTQAEALALAGACTSVNTLVINATEPIDISGIGQISGSLIVQDAPLLTSLTSSTLNTIGGSFTLARLTTLSSLNFRSLSSVGSISWTTLPNIQTLSFTTGISRAGNVLITDTGLTSLAGINLMSVGIFEITNNGFLRSISSPIVNSTGGITLNNNGQDLAVSFPKLTTSLNMTIRNASSLEVPHLQTVNGTFGVYGSYMTNLTLANLTTVKGDAAFVADLSLVNITAPLLTSLSGALLIANNTNLLDISGFPKLATTGAINLSGNFTTAVLPALTDVKGTFNAQSSGNFSCAPFDTSAFKTQVVKGQSKCVSNSNNVQANVGAGAVTGTGTAASASKTGAAGAVVVPGSSVAFFTISAIVGGFAMAGGLMQMVL